MNCVKGGGVEDGNPFHHSLRGLGTAVGQAF
jgi:hypothetical protein